MTIYVAEIGGRAIVAFAAEDRVQAEMTVDEEWFLEDILVLKSDGKPLWDGESELHLREAFDEEADKWRHAQAEALAEGDIDGADDDHLVYLVSVNDPTDEAFNDDEP